VRAAFAEVYPRTAMTPIDPRLTIRSSRIIFDWMLKRFKPIIHRAPDEIVDVSLHSENTCRLSTVRGRFNQVARAKNLSFCPL
jgi:hypothetical protein